MRRPHVAAIILVLAAAGCTDNPPATDDLEVALAIQGHVAGDEAVTATVTITNVSDHDLPLLAWYLPDADLQEPLFQLTRDGQPVAYTGPRYKRATPDASDYVTLAPGEVLTRSVDLAKFYDVSATGHYSVGVTLDNTRLRHAPGLVGSSLVDAQIEGRTVRILSAKPTTATCNSDQLAQIAMAKSTATQYAASARDYLGATPSATERYTSWFGAFSTSGWSMARTHFTSIANAFATQNVTFDCSCRQKNVYAFVNPNQPYLITVCGAFWSAPQSGTDSKAGTLVHEMSHFNTTAATDDWAYGKTACTTLAQTDPAKALDNADSHEYFAENTPALQ